MKKIILILGVLFLSLAFTEVKADTFYEAEYISGEYINKVKDGKTYYLTVQFIKNDKGEIVYCLEPFATFTEGTGYSGKNFSYEYYTGLSNEQMRRIEKLAYYGYNYIGRMDAKWYAITQYLIWKTVDTSADIYFTDTLNGKRIDKYQTEIAMLENDIKLSNTNPSFIGKTLEVNYKDLLILEDSNQVLKDYKVLVSDYDYVKEDNVLKIDNMVEDGRIVFKRINDYYNSSGYVYIHSSSQMLYKPGNPRENEISVKFEITKGDILLNVYDDDSIYTVENDFSNTCYGVYNNQNEIVDKLCTNQEISYKTQELPYGEYFIKQESVGLGYRKDNNVYKVNINKNNEHVVIELKNILIRNKIIINKQYCKNDECNFEVGSRFNIYDKNNNLVNVLETDTLGEAFIELGYGTYLIEQIEGVEGYSYIEPFEVFIEDEISNYEYSLKDEIILKEDVQLNNSPIELPPDTGLDDYNKSILIKFIKRFIQVLKKFCLL